MSDLVDQLRSGLDNSDGGEMGGVVLTMKEAADRIEALEEQVRAADALAEAGERYRGAVAGMLVQLERTGALDSIVSDLFPESKKRGVLADQGFAAVDAARNNVKQWSDVYDASAAAYRATKEGGA